MAPLSSEDRIRWLKKRKSTLIIFAFESLLIGIQYSIIFLTLWLYLMDLVKPEHPKVYYGIVSVAYLIGSLLITTLVGRIVDRFKCVRLLFLCCNTLCIIGNIIYALPFSAWLLVVGRFITGAGFSLRGVMSSELARCYASEELSSKLSTMGMAYAFGFVIGPGINILFEKVDFKLFAWHITYENMPSICLSIIYLLSMLLTHFWVYDLSKEYCLKDNEDKIDDNRNSVVRKRCQIGETSFSKSNDETLCRSKTNDKQSLLTSHQKHRNLCDILKKLLSNVDVCLILFVSSFSRYIILTSDMWVPLLVIETMKWNVTQMNLIIIGTAMSCLTMLVFLMFKRLSDRTSYILAIISIVFLSLLLSVFMILSTFPSNFPLSIVFWTIFCLSVAFINVNEEIFLISCLAKMVDSNIQSFTEALRLSFTNVGALVALSTSALFFDKVVLVSFGYIAVIFIMAVGMILRRKSLSRPVLTIGEVSV